MRPVQNVCALSPERKLWIMLGTVSLILLSVEFMTRAMHDRRRVTLTIERGIHEALIIRHTNSRKQLLFAGNSLIFEDLSQSALQQRMGTGFVVYTAGVPGSTYYDWRYGLRSLFARGSQPDVLIFGISPSQFLRGAAVTPMPVSRLWRTREIIAYGRGQHVNLTIFSELVLERYSTFFSLRDTVRIYFRKFIPGYEAMLGGWARSAPAPSTQTGEATEAVFSERISQLASECDPHARLILLIAPTNQVVDEAMEPALRAAAEQLGVTVVEPVRERQWPLTNFQEDGYHLKPSAAAEFSNLVGGQLKRTLDYRPDHDSGQ